MSTNSLKSTIPLPSWVGGSSGGSSSSSGGSKEEEEEEEWGVGIKYRFIRIMKWAAVSYLGPRQNKGDYRWDRQGPILIIDYEIIVWGRILLIVSDFNNYPILQVIDIKIALKMTSKYDFK